MIDIKLLKEIALANVSDPDSAYFYRYVCRWYSKTFHTPLHLTYGLPSQDIFMAYFEEGYEAMDDDDRNLEMMKTVDPDFDEKEEEAIDDFINLIEAEEENKRAKAASVKKTEPIEHIDNTTVIRTYQDSTPDDESGV